MRQNAILAAHYGAGKRRSWGTVEDVMQFCGLSPSRFDEPAGAISVFEKKKLAIATALATRPEMLLLDEPASGLTGPEVQELIHLIRMIRERGVTILVIEHVLSLLLAVSERLVVLEQGSVIAQGEPTEVMRHTRVVEAYLGRKAKETHVGSRH
jgi:branched-chain amino acid transport system ATP-binding protein